MGGGPWEDAWGTSIASPSWDAIFAIVNQERAALGKPSLSGTSQTLPMLYSQAGTNAFNQVSTYTTGNLSPTNITAPSPIGGGTYNTLAGLGTPDAQYLIPYLVGPTLKANVGSWDASNTTLTLTGSHFLSNATYSVTFNDNVGGTTTYTPTYVSATTLTVSIPNGLTGLDGTPLTATVTMTTTTGPIYMDTTGTAVPVFPLVTVGPLPNLLPEATLQSAYNQTFTASGGTGGALYFSAVGNLPPGMTLSPTGVLSGTDTKATDSGKTFTFTVYATDAAGLTGSQTYTLTMTPAITIGPAPLPAVASVTITNGGTGYSSSSPPTVIFSAPSSGGITAIGTAVVTNGSVTAVNITNPGVGYTKAPIITFSGSGGAAATVKITTSAGAVYPLVTGTSGNSYSEVLAAHGGAGGYTYTENGLPAEFSLDRGTGLITSTNLTQSGSFSFTVTATDRAGASSIPQPFSIFVSPLFVFRPGAPLPQGVLDTGTVGSSYPSSGSIAFQVGGGPSGDSYTFSFAGGQPTFNGLTLTTTGNLSGTPSRAGVYNVTVKATDTTKTSADYNMVGLANYLWTVKLGISSGNLNNATVGTPYTGPTYTASGGNTYIYSAVNLPAGLTLTNVVNSKGVNQGVLSGTPTVSGKFTFEVTATDNNDPGLNGSQKYTLTVNGATITAPLGGYALPAGTVGVPYAAQLGLTGGDTIDTISVSGLTNSGLHLDTSTDTLVGTPLVSGTFYVTVSVTDTNGLPGGAVFPLYINPGLALRPGSLPAASVGQQYSQQFTALGGSGNYSFASQTIGGLTLSTSGNLSGTPTSAGLFPFTVRVTDKDNLSLVLQQDYSLSVSALTVYTVGANPSNALTATAGQLISQQFAASGGSGGAIYDFTETGSLPAGITLSPSGLLNGTTSVIGTFNFTVNASDSTDKTGSQQYTLTINPGSSLVIGPTVLPPARAGQSYSLPLSTTGSFGKSTFTGADLPSWLKVTTSGNLTASNVPKPPTPSTVTFTVTATNGPNGATASLSSGGSLTVGNTYYYEITATQGNLQTTVSNEVSLTPTVAPLAPPTPNTPTTSATGGSLAANTYNYVITALNANGETTASNQVSVTTTGTMSSNTVTWGAVTGATGYNVYRGTASSGDVYYSVSGGSTTSFMDTGTPPTGSASPPTNNTTGQSAKLSWTAVSGATGYKVYRGTSSGGEDLLIATQSGNSNTTFQDTGLGGTQATPPPVASQTYTLAIQADPPGRYTPQQITQAYGINNVILSGGIVGDGAGQTIAIVIDFGDPGMVSSTDPNFANSDLSAYDAYMGLPNFEPVGSFTGQTSGPNTLLAVGLTGVVVGQGVSGPGIPAGDTIAAITSAGYPGFSIVTLTRPVTKQGAVGTFSTGPFFLKLDEYGGTNYPSISLKKGKIDVGEETQDIETVHALAPEANIVVFEAETGLDADIAQARQTAMSYPGVTVVSMSLGGSQSGYTTPAGEAAVDSTFLAPQSNPNVTFVVAGGDNNDSKPGDPAAYPASSPYVLAAGASQLTTDAQGNYLGEEGLDKYSHGPTNYEPQPSYQNGVVPAVSSVPNTTIASTSSGKSLATTTSLYVVSNLNFPHSGDLEIQTSAGPELVKYTGWKNPTKSSTYEFTGLSLLPGNMSGDRKGKWQTGNVILIPSTPPATTIASSQTLSSTINVASTVGFPTAGALTVPTSSGSQIVTYTGITAGSFTGVSPTSTSTLPNGGAVTLAGYSPNTTPYPPTTTVTGAQTLPEGQIEVATTANFPAAGALALQTSTGSLTLVDYTGLASSGGNTYFTGVTGGTGTLANGALVTLAGGGGTDKLLSNNLVTPYSVQRATPDVSFNGNLSSGFATFSSIFLSPPFADGDGSSEATPSWAALIGLANQGEALVGNSPLNGPTGTLPDLYNLPASDFNKLTQLASGGTSVGSTTFNQSGLGSPVANRLIAGLVGGSDTISGQVVNSSNGLAGWAVFLSDSATSKVPIAGEATTTTDANGYFHFLVAPGTYYVHVVPAPGWTSSGNVSLPIKFDSDGDQAQTTASFQFQPPAALSITTQPASATIDNGQTDTLSVTAGGGTTPYSYQWYIGPSGTTTNPISGATGSTFIASPTSTTSYWVQVNDLLNNTINSNTATITVNPALGIGTQPAGTTIDNGQSDTLSVTASGGTTPYSYQWYIGNMGDTSKPISGATSSSYVASPTTTTSYWVLVTDSAAGTPPASADSNTATITVNPAITISPTTLPTAALGILYSRQLTASGGSGSGYIFTPTTVDGLNLSSAGLLSGKPAAIGNFPITVQVTDSIGGTGSQNYTLSVVAPQQTVGVFDPSTGNWYLRNSNSAGAPDISPFAYGAPGWYPIVGDWNGDGVTTIGVVDLSTETWYLRNSNSPGAPDFTPFQFGAPGWIPVAGDWNGTGHTGIGVFNPATATWYLRTEIGAGAPDAGQFQYGGGGWKPVVGDWTGQGKTTIGVVDPSTETWYLRNSNSGGAPDVAPFAYGAPGWVPVAGDWTGIGHSGIGVVNGAAANWYLRTEVGAGAPDAGQFQYGGGNWGFVVGDWDFPALPQLAAGGEAAVPAEAAPLTEGQLQSEVQAALNLLASDGVNSALRAKLGSLQFTVGQLPAGYLGLSDVATGQVEISADAAGYDWFVDANPSDSVPANRMDLLTVVLHEMGHFNGWSELDPATNPDALMALTLGTGIRRTQDVDAVFAAGL